jgi:hypothetical protein
LSEGPSVWETRDLIAVEEISYLNNINDGDNTIIALVIVVEASLIHFM